jgi:hypothetical protein
VVRQTLWYAKHSPSWASSHADKIIRRLERDVFPWIGGKPTVNAALRRLGYDRATMTAHGFRGIASTMLHGIGWPSDVVERQLAHAERKSVKASTNSALGVKACLTPAAKVSTEPGLSTPAWESLSHF